MNPVHSLVLMVKKEKRREEGTGERQEGRGVKRRGEVRGIGVQEKFKKKGRQKRGAERRRE